ncbi:ABC transporter ATP-binding protein [Neobacillus niacini]|uniref:ABC transporter ATP-binding protein n=1 Tax=Neobacillus niacini TaxID=86668 RepID=UPI002FFDC022
MNLLEINNLDVQYGDIKALKNINLKIRKGQIVSILGANGAGKSTLLKSISGLLQPKEGEIQFEEKSIIGIKPHNITRLGISHVPEGRQIFTDLTIEENLNVGAHLVKDRKQTGNDLKNIYELFPVLLERRKQKGGTLSGGEQQMLALSRGLVSKPSLLMIDELSLGLAPIVIQLLFKELIRIKKSGTTILLVEQNANMALKVADYVYVLKNGEVVLEGKPIDINGVEDLKKSYLGN